MIEAKSTAAGVPAFSDFLTLAKPRITIFSLITTAGGAALGAAEPSLGVWLALLCGTALTVGSANALNMYLERDIDCRMARTKNRPLPAGRMEPSWALGFGAALAACGIPILTFGVNPLTGLLGAIALLSYVNLYTPLKQRTTLATLIGSVPGAMPVLMGWTAATGSIDVAGLTLFGVMFLWQIPHFHAISLYRFKDYHRAGLVILPMTRGAETTRFAILFYLAAQVQLSLLLFPLGVAGVWYAAAAAILGGAYFLYAVSGIRTGGPRWARNLFLLSNLYLPALFTVMVIDGIG